MTERSSSSSSSSSSNQPLHPHCPYTYSTATYPSTPAHPSGNVLPRTHLAYTVRGSSYGGSSAQSNSLGVPRLPTLVSTPQTTSSAPAAPRFSLFGTSGPVAPRGPIPVPLRVPDPNPTPGPQPTPLPLYPCAYA